MRILVLKDFGIGNLVNGTPMMQAIRAAHPDAQIDLMCCDEAVDVVMGWPVLNAIWPYARGDAVDALPGYDAYVICRPVSGRFKVPRNGKAVGSTLDRECWAKHEVEWNMELAVALGYREVAVPAPHFELDADEWFTLHVSALKGAIGVHVGCHPSWPWKRWPIEHWAELVRVLSGSGFQVVVVGGPSERQDADQLAKLVDGHHVIDLVGKLSLKQSASVIRQCRAFISTDSGPMHVASALRVPTLGLFGPTSTTKNRPWFGKVVWSKEALECRPCQEKGGMEVMKNCPYGYRCLTELMPEQVFWETMGLFGG